MRMADSSFPCVPSSKIRCSRCNMSHVPFGSHSSLQASSKSAQRSLTTHNGSTTIVDLGSVLNVRKHLRLIQERGHLEYNWNVPPWRICHTLTVFLLTFLLFTQWKSLAFVHKALVPVLYPLFIMDVLTFLLCVVVHIFIMPCLLHTPTPLPLGQKKRHTHTRLRASSHLLL